MILGSLKLLSHFRGLPAGYEIVFRQLSERLSDERVNVEPLCLVGLNGSGKSNVLEVLAEIFYYLESYHQADRFGRNGLARFETSFGFSIDYQLPRNTVLARIQDWPELQALIERTHGDPIISIHKAPEKYPTITASIEGVTLELSNSNRNREIGVLPTRVIGYSSGMNELLSNPFIKIDFDYLEDLKKKTDNASISTLDMNRLFFMNYASNKCIVLANYLFDSNPNALDDDALGNINVRNIKKETGIDDIVFFSLTLQLEKAPGDAFQYLPSELNIAIDRLKACATFSETTERAIGKTVVRKTIRYDYWVNSATKAAFKDQFKTAYELFRAFYFLQLLNNELVGKVTRTKISNAKAGSLENLSDEIPRLEGSKLRFHVHDVKLKLESGTKVEYRKLSDGEHQLLQVVGLVLLMDTPGALFLLDEPETHFNPDWRSKFVRLLNDSIDKERNQEFLITTHSPFIISDCKRENVLVFARRKNGVAQVPRRPTINTYGTAVSILTDEVFEKSETVSDMALATIERIRKMPSETTADIGLAIKETYLLGESPEKVLLLRELLLRRERLERKNA